MPICIVTGRIIESTKLKELDTHELAWAAGFFDGEGTTYTHLQEGNRNPALTISIKQKYLPNLKRFKRALLGKGRLYLNQHNRTIHMYKSATFEESQAIIAMLWKYLSGEKRYQMIEALRKYRENYKGNLMIYSGYGSLKMRELSREKHRSKRINGNSQPSSPALPNAVLVNSITEETSGRLED